MEEKEKCVVCGQEAFGRVAFSVANVKDKDAILCRQHYHDLDFAVGQMLSEKFHRSPRNK